MAAQHTDPEDAIQIMRDLDAKAAVGIHWGTFKLTDEPRDEPASRLAAALCNSGCDPKSFIALQPGEVANFAVKSAGEIDACAALSTCLPHQRAEP
jgi:L-ascorbate metabolism protein UlaG (beta-lactamase superfamily)